MMTARKAANREAIVDHALDLFVLHGYEAVRVEDISKAAGVSRATFYNHFSDREEVVAALFERLLSVDDDVDDRFDAQGPPLERVAQVAGAAARRMMSRPTLARFLYTLPVRQESLLKPDHPATPKVFLTIHRLLEAAAAQGELRTDVPIDLMCIHVHGALEQAMRAWAAGETDDPVARVQILVDLALHGVVTPTLLTRSP